MASHIFFLTILQKSKLIFIDSLPTEKSLALHNDTIHIKSVINKDKDHYYYKIFRKML